ncbi:YdcF family protein [Gammaproteobacteria bacterium]
MVGRIIGRLLLPPGGLLVLLWFGFLLRHKIIGILLLGAGLVLFTLLSIPAVGDLLYRSNIGTSAPLSEAELRRGADAIVVLGSGGMPAPEYGGDTVNPNTLQRLRYGARLHRLTGLPIYVSGGGMKNVVHPDGELMREVLAQEYGITAEAEIVSRNTAENASESATLLASRGVRRIFLVTHAYHMSRAVEQFQNHGLEVIPAPTLFLTDVESSWTIEDFIPRISSLWKSSVALHEYLGRFWYLLRY